MKNSYQTPLFLTEIRSLLKDHGAKTIVDATFGEGGHGISFAQDGMFVYGLEWDEEMLINAQKRVDESQAEKNVALIHANFAHLTSVLPPDTRKIDAVIFDLGLSMRQLRTSGRGFTFEGNEPLDLRINTSLTQTAAQIIRRSNESELIDLFQKFIEDTKAGPFAQAVLRARFHQGIQSVGDVAEIVKKIIPTEHGQELFMRKALQGLRMIVNNELENIEKGLHAAAVLLQKDGLVIVITFHSLEDRVVKLYFKNNLDSWKALYKKPLSNSQSKFARSAKLRAYIKT